MSNLISEAIKHQKESKESSDALHAKLAIKPAPVVKAPVEEAPATETEGEQKAEATESNVNVTLEGEKEMFTDDTIKRQEVAKQIAVDTKKVETKKEIEEPIIDYGNTDEDKKLRQDDSKEVKEVTNSTSSPKAMPEIETSTIAAPEINDEVLNEKSSEKPAEKLIKEIKVESKPAEKPKQAKSDGSSFTIEESKLDGAEESTGETPIPIPAPAQDKKPVLVEDKKPLVQKPAS